MRNANDEQLRSPTTARVACPQSGMVEVFRTDVEQHAQAALLLDNLRRRFPEYRATFDLEDCDRILRIESAVGYLNVPAVTGLLAAFGFCIEVLTDDEDTPAVLQHSGVFAS